MEAVCRNKLNVAKQTQTSKWHNLGCSWLEGMFQRSSVCCCTFLFLPLSCACQWNAFMLIFILCEFYISSGGWEGKTFHLGNAPNFCTHPNLVLPTPKIGGNLHAWGRAFSWVSFSCKAFLESTRKFLDWTINPTVKDLILPHVCQCEKRPWADSTFSSIDVFSNVPAVFIFKFAFCLCVEGR